MVGKNSKERMSWDIAKKTIDYVLDNEWYFNEESVIWDFIGGEPFLEIDLIDQICDYIKIELFKRNHKWFNSYRFNFSTNGLNYHNDKVQNFIKKNLDHLSVTITIDGKQMESCGSTILFIEEGLLPDVEFDAESNTYEFDGKYKVFRKENDGKDFKPRRENVSLRRSNERTDGSKRRFDKKKDYKSPRKYDTRKTNNNEKNI